MVRFPVRIELTADEIHMGATHAIYRRCMKHRGLRGDRVQKEVSTWDNEINGALAEVAFCKWRNKYWSGVTGLRANDAPDAEVRWTKHEGNGGLIVYDHDKDEAIYVLMDGGPPVFNVVGFMRGREAKAVGNRVSFGILVDRAQLRLEIGEKANGTN